MDVEGSSCLGSSNVQLYTFNASDPRQIFHLEARLNSEGSYEGSWIVNDACGKVVANTGTCENSASSVGLQNLDPSDPTQKVSFHSDGTVRIPSCGRRYAIIIGAAGGDADGANIITWTLSGGWNELWKVVWVNEAADNDPYNLTTTAYVAQGPS